MEEQRHREIEQALQRYALRRGAIVCPLGHGTDISAALRKLFEDAVEKTGIPKEEMVEWGILFLKSFLSEKK